MTNKNNYPVENSAQLSELSLQQEKRLNEKVTVKDIDEVYRRMTRLYGHKFTSNYGESDDGTWLMALSGLKRSDLSRGLTTLLSIDDDWPPSVPKFRQLCLGQNVDQPSKAAHKEYISIAPIKTSPEDAKDNVKKLRGAVSGLFAPQYGHGNAVIKDEAYLKAQDEMNDAMRGFVDNINLPVK